MPTMPTIIPKMGIWGAYQNVIRWGGQYYAHQLFYKNAKTMLDGQEEKLHRVIV